MNDETFMRLAIEKAKEGLKNGPTPFGACIVKNNQVITCVHNAVWQTKDITAHAEIHAIREACKHLNTIDLSGCIIYSTCEPCPMCFSACHWAKISKIFYGTRIEDAEAAGFQELTISNHQMKQLGNSLIEVVGDFLREESLEIFNTWKTQQHKVLY